MRLQDGNRRLQTAIEYLIIYGLALLIITIAIATLFHLFQNPQSKVPNSCIFSGGVTCTELLITSNSMTSNTAVVVLLTNAASNKIISPSAKLNVNGTNSSSFGCLPANVPAGGSIKCILYLNSTKSSSGQAVSGTIYFFEQNCAFSATNGCQTPLNQIYAGKFEGSAQICTNIQSCT